MNAFFSLQRPSRRALPLAVCASGLLTAAHFALASPAPPMSGKNTAKMKVVGESANGQTISLRAGEILVVRLPENPTTGYGRALLQMPQMPIRLLDQQYSAAPHAPGMTGSGGVHQWRFVAAGKSSFRRGAYLKFLSLRSFEKGVTNAPLWEIQVTIPAAS